MSKKFRAMNITHLIPGQTGYFLNFHGVLLQPGKPTTIDIDHLQKMKKNENSNIDVNMLYEWVNKGLLRLKDADTNELITVGIDDMSAPVPAVNEAIASDHQLEHDLEEFDMKFDPSDAHEAVLPKEAYTVPGRAIGAHSPPTNNVVGARAKISYPGEENSSDTADGLSPIPGDKPVPVDDSAQFTVKAPRANLQGGVIKS